MSQMPEPRLQLHGAVDLSRLGRAPAPAPGGRSSAAVVDVADEATFSDVVQRSATVPVVMVLWASWSEASTAVVDHLAALAEEYAGRFLLARLDVDASPQLAQAVGAQSVPSVLGVLRGQPVPLFAGPAEPEQIRDLLDRLLQVAAQHQVTGTVTDQSPDAGDAEPAEPPLPPLHAEAYQAIEEGDLDRAAESFRRAVAQNPRDDMAVAGLAQVELLRRVRDLDPAEVLARAQAEPADLAAQLDLADLEFGAGRVEDAFARLLAAVRRSSGPDRDRARERLIELFTVLGDADPRVVRTRRDLASALY